MGQRANAQGLDLNRDFMKLEAPETRALVRFLNEWDPHLIVDTHTTNGSHHRYTITYDGPKNPAGRPSTDRLLAGEALPRGRPGAREGDRATSRSSTGTSRATTPDGPRSRPPPGSARPTSASGTGSRCSPRPTPTPRSRTGCSSPATSAGPLLEFADRPPRRDPDPARRRPAVDHRGRAGDPTDRVAIRSKARALPGKATVLGFVERAEDGRTVATGEPKDYPCDLEIDFAPDAGGPPAVRLPDPARVRHRRRRPPGPRDRGRDPETRSRARPSRSRRSQPSPGPDAPSRGTRRSTSSTSKTTRQETDGPRRDPRRPDRAAAGHPGRLPPGTPIRRRPRHLELLRRRPRLPRLPRHPARNPSRSPPSPALKAPTPAVEGRPVLSTLEPTRAGRSGADALSTDRTSPTHRLVLAEERKSMKHSASDDALMPTAITLPYSCHPATRRPRSSAWIWRFNSPVLPPPSARVPVRVVDGKFNIRGRWGRRHGRFPGERIVSGIPGAFPARRSGRGSWGRSAWPCRSCSGGGRGATGLRRRTSGFGRAKSCILIFQWGGPSQLDTWDPKPDAPAEIRGEFASIATSNPGAADLRAFPAARPAGAPAGGRPVDDARRPGAPLDGPPAPDRPPGPDAQLRRRAPLLERLAAPGLAGLASSGPSPGSLPSAVTMPWVVAHPAAPGGRAPGQHGGWLGKAFDPFRVDGDPNAPGFRVGGLDLPEGVDPGPDGRPPVAALGGLAGAGMAGAGARLVGRLPGPGARRPGLGRGPGGLPGRARRPQDPRPLRPAHPRPVPPPGPSAGRGGRRPGHGQLARRRPELLGHPRRQLQPAQERPDAPGRPGASPPCSTTWTPAACSTRPWSSGPASSAGPRGSPPPTPAASTGRGATRWPWPAAGSAAARSTGPATAGPPTPPATRSAPTTWAPPSSTPSGSTRPPRSRTPSAAPRGSTTAARSAAVRLNGRSRPRATPLLDDPVGDELEDGRVDRLLDPGVLAQRAGLAGLEEVVEPREGSGHGPVRCRPS